MRIRLKSRRRDKCRRRWTRSNLQGEALEDRNLLMAASIVGRHLFYNNSAFDSGDPAANSADDGAIAPNPINAVDSALGKKPLIAGQPATFQHYSNYSRGLNGIMVDIQGLANPAGIDESDFVFRVGNNHNPTTWAAAPVPAFVGVRVGAGVDGSDRVTVTWADNAIEQSWLQVKVLANADTGLLADDTHYWGNQIGETGNQPGNSAVNALDVGEIVNHPTGFSPAGIENRWDLNKSNSVNALDVGVAVNHPTGFSSLALFTPNPIGTLFADSDLEAAVRQVLQIPAGTPVTTADMLGLTSLSVNSNVIDSLIGLEHATNLSSLELIPDDYSDAGHLTSLLPISSLSNLTHLVLQRSGIDNNVLSTLGSPASLDVLDLQYNAITDVSALSSISTLASLKLYGNPNVDLSALAGRLLTIDLPANDVPHAQTPSELADALHNLPIEMYEYVVNHFEFELYAGAMKGPQAVLETGAGNDWDMASLLAEMFDNAGIATRYVSGEIEVPIDVAMDYVGATDADAAALIMANAGIDQILINDAGGDPVAMRFDHAWLEAELTLPGGGTQWMALDPSWKFRDFQPGMNITAMVPFDEAGYLSVQRKELAHEFYEAQVRSYLAANHPTVSIADVPYDGPILAQSFDAIPNSLPYSVLSTSGPYTTIPTEMTHRVTITLRQFSPLFSTTVSLPEVSLDRLTIGYASTGGAGLIPRLLQNGSVIETGAVVGSGSNVQLDLIHYDPGDNIADRSFTYDRTAGQYIAIGLDARQTSERSIAELRQVVNDTAIAQANGDPFDVDDQVGGLLHLAVTKWFFDTNKGEDITDALTHGIGVYNSVGSGITTADAGQDFYDPLQVQYIPRGMNIDVANNYHSSFPLDNDTSHDMMRQILGEYNDSAQEHAIWEEVVSSEAVSTIKSLQVANEQGIPIYVIDSGNAATYLPLLTHRSSIRTAIQAEVAAGATVTVPRDETPIQNWSGVGYITRKANSVGYIINGGLNSSSPTAVSGGFIVGFPFLWPFLWFNPFSFFAGDPISVGNGSVRENTTDISIPGVGIPMEFSRQYDSLNSDDRGMGPGWSFTYSDRLEFEGDGSITWFDANANRFNFQPDGGGFLTPDAIYGTFSAITGGYLWRDKTGNEREFDATGKLVRIADRYGNGYGIAYDGSDQISLVTDLFTPSRQLSFTYAAGLLTAVSDFAGRTWSYGYTGGYLSQVTLPSDADTPLAVTQYDYYTDPTRDGLLHTITKPNGGVIEYSYYPNRRGFQVTDPEGFTQTLSYNGYRNQTYFTDERGNTTTYTYDDQGNLISELHPDRSTNTKVWQDLLLQSATDAMGQTEYYQYDSQGNLTRLEDRGGFVTAFTYEPVFNNLTVAERPGGRITQFTYDASGNLISTQDPLGNVSEITYDGRGQMLTYTAPKGVLTPTAGDYLVTYTYNDAGQTLTRTTDLPTTESFTYDDRGNLLALTDANGNTSSFEFDLLNREILNRDALGHETATTLDNMGDIIAMTDALGRTTTYTYDLKQQLITTVFADGTMLSVMRNPVGDVTDSTDESGFTTQYSYDDMKRIVQTRYPDGAIESMRYDGSGRMIQSTNGRGFSTSYAYDPLDRLIKTTDALGNSVTRTYDEVGNTETVTDELGNTTTYGYDLLGRRLTVEDALSNVTTSTYDEHGNLATVTDPLGRTMTYGYDVIDRRVVVTDGLGNITTTTYDEFGNPTTIVDPLGHATTYTYDSLNRMENSIDDLGGTTTHTYDAVGNELTITDPVGNQTSYTYDARDRIVAETNQLGDARTFVYDARGNRVEATDRNGRIRQMMYDSRNRMSVESWLDDALQPVNTISSIYDLDGNMLQVADMTSTYNYTYDPLGRMESVAIEYAGAFLGGGGPVSLIGSLGPGDGTVSDGGGGVGYFDQYTFDAAAGDNYTIDFESSDFDTYLILISPFGAQYHDDDGGTGTNSRISLTLNETGTWTIWATSYPSLGTGNYELTIDDGSLPGLKLDYTYDAAGNLTSITDSLGGLVEHDYDVLNRVDQIRQSGSSVVSKRVDFAYDDAGQMTDVMRFSDLSGTTLVAASVYTYHPVVSGRLTDLTHSNSSLTLANYAWSYDAASRITSMSSPDGVSTFSYDDTDQLTVANHNYQADENYLYDANGNRIGGGYVVGVNNRIQSDGTFNYEFDAEGNLIARTNIVSGEVRRFEWDHRNRLIAVVDEDSLGDPVLRVEYTYDALNRRIAKSVDTTPQDGLDGAVTYFVYDDINVHLELSDIDGASGPAAAALAERYLHGPGVDQVMAQEDAASNVEWMLADHQGTVRDLVDNAGGVLNHLSYDAFGRITNQTNPLVDTRYGFTGREYDAETGLHYYRARYYDTAIGKFISEDPIGFEGGDDNLFRYVKNSPVGFVDPTGRSFSDALEWLHGVLDAIGIFEPTPFADGLNAIIYALEGKWGYAGISAMGIIPYLGDSAKVGKYALKFHKVSDLLDAGRALDKGGLTKAGRALQKHGDRAGSAFPKSVGDAAARNSQGEKVLKDILESKTKTIKNNRFGGQDIFDNTTGRGVRYDKDGNMMGFLEP